jgi:hypothetical protein
LYALLLVFNFIIFLPKTKFLKEWWWSIEKVRLNLANMFCSTLESILFNNFRWFENCKSFQFFFFSCFFFIFSKIIYKNEKWYVWD